MYLFYKDMLYLLSSALYISNRVLLKYDILDASFLRNHFNDFLLIPCLLPPLNHLLIKIGARNSNEPPNFVEIIICLTVWTIAFEVIAPQISSRATADPLDVLCYIAGGVVAWLYWKKQQIHVIKL